jgi:hypothetical protein
MKALDLYCGAGGATRGLQQAGFHITGKNHRSESNLPWEYAFAAFGMPIGSTTLAELSDAIPPAYSRFVAEAWKRASTSSPTPGVDHKACAVTAAQDGPGGFPAPPMTPRREKAASGLRVASWRLLKQSREE